VVLYLHPGIVKCIPDDFDDAPISVDSFPKSAAQVHLYLQFYYIYVDVTLFRVRKLSTCMGGATGGVGGAMSPHFCRGTVQGGTGAVQ